MRAKSLQLCLTLFDPMDHNLPASSAHGILQPRILEWVSMTSSSDLPNPRIKLDSYISYIGRRVLYHLATEETLI